jgi:Prophage CP4-57 regulatory protein (AlpA)
MLVLRRYQKLSESNDVEDGGKRQNSVSSPLLLGGVAPVSADEVKERVAEAFDLLGDRPSAGSSDRSPYDAKLVGIIACKGQRADLPLIDGPTRYRFIQARIGPAQTDEAVNGCPIADRDPNDFVGPQAYEFGETVCAGATGRSTWRAGVKSGRFPKPVKLGPHTTAWKVEDIRTFIEKAE